MSLMIHRDNWTVYSTNDIGPLMYVDRYNGGAFAFYYNKKDNTLIVRNRPVYSPYAYIPHDGGRKDKQTGNFYKFYVDNNVYYCSVNDAINYLPEELPSECVDSTGFIETEASEIVKDFIYKIDTNSHSVKLLTDGNLDDIDSINELTIFDTDSDLDIFTLHREYVDSKKIFVFLVDLTFGREEFRYKSDIETKDDFNKALMSTVSALYRYPTFRRIAEDLEQCL